MAGSPRPGLPLRSLLPNAMTLGSLVAGLTAMRLAIEGRFDVAALLILAAGILDGLDGRLARRIGGESAMGAELDSLCDAINFGVAPALVLHLWAWGPAGGDGWIAALVYAAACVLRLARFNIGSREPAPAAPAGPPAAKSFTGVPSPAGALLVLLPLFVAQVAPALAAPPLLVAAWMVAVGGLMVSRLRTPAIQPLRVAPERARLLLLGGVAAAALLVTHPWATLVLVDLAYLAVLARAALAARRPTPEA